MKMRTFIFSSLFAIAILCVSGNAWAQSAQQTFPPLKNVQTVAPVGAPLSDAAAIQQQLNFARQIDAARIRGDSFGVAKILAKQAQAATKQSRAKAAAQTATGGAGGANNGGGGGANSGGGGWKSSNVYDPQALSSQAIALIEKWTEGCKLCSIFKDLEEIKTVWTIDIYHTIAPSITNVLKNLMLLYAAIMGVLMFTKPAEAPAMFKKFVISMVVMSVVLLMLNTAKDQPPFAWIFLHEIENSALKLGVLIIQSTAGTPIPLTEANGLYAALTDLIEKQMWGILRIAAEILRGGTAIGITDALSRLVTSVALMLPYIFVVGIFIAFLVEAMFKFISISMLSPLLMPCLIFGWSRAYVTASLRIILGAFLTIVFASMAMGLTVKVVHTKMASIDAVRAQSGPAIEEAKAAAQKKCARNGLMGIDIIGAAIDLNLWGRDIIGIGKADVEKKYLAKRAACSKNWEPVEKLENATFSTLSQEYFILVIIGFMSVLLHLQAKSLASNISGASDGSGPAAATVAATKLTLGAAAVYGQKAMVGGKGSSGVGGLVGGAVNAGGAGAGMLKNVTNPLRRGPVSPMSSGPAKGGGHNLRG